MAGSPADGPVSPPGNEATSPESSPDWVGYWRVQRWDGEAPPVPTYYVATTESWDVVKREANHEPHIAAHPILEISEHVIVLKDEGGADEHAERWRTEVSGDTLRVAALTGPHEGAVGVAERIAKDPRRSVPGEAEEDGR